MLIITALDEAKNFIISQVELPRTEDINTCNEIVVVSCCVLSVRLALGIYIREAKNVGNVRVAGS